MDTTRMNKENRFAPSSTYVHEIEYMYVHINTYMYTRILYSPSLSPSLYLSQDRVICSFPLSYYPRCRQSPDLSLSPTALGPLQTKPNQTKPTQSLNRKGKTYARTAHPVCALLTHRVRCRLGILCSVAALPVPTLLARLQLSEHLTYRRPAVRSVLPRPFVNNHRVIVARMSRTRPVLVFITCMYVCGPEYK